MRRTLGIAFALPLLSAAVLAQTDPSQSQPQGQTNTTTTQARSESWSKSNSKARAERGSWQGTLVDGKCRTAAQASGVKHTGMATGDMGNNSTQGNMTGSDTQNMQGSSDTQTMNGNAHNMGMHRKKGRHSMDSGMNTSNAMGSTAGQSCTISDSTNTYALKLNDGRMVSLNTEGSSTVDLQLQRIAGQLKGDNLQHQVQVTGILEGDSIQMKSIRR